MSEQGWSGPPPVPSGPSLVNHVGDLLYVRFHHPDREVNVNGQIKPGVTISWHVLDGRTKGATEEERTLTNVMVVRQLEHAEPGSIFFSRVGQKSTGGPNPAVFLDDPWQSDKPIIEAFLARRSNRQPQQEMPPTEPPAPQQYREPEPAQQSQQGYTEEPPF